VSITDPSAAEDLAAILTAAYAFDDKPHRLFAAIRAAAERHEGDPEWRTETVRLMDRAYDNIQHARRVWADALWTDEWPTEEGYYWFYGHTSRHRADRPYEINVVQVAHGANCTVYICRGALLYKVEGADGVWQPVYPPELP
jgi:NADPH-dependent ferric siderophore reductase